ncbi:hypothetical protein GT037_002580 [Alternaria burnsii]|uniref:Uncharacterized protein n=1 Tax=Alternaria burnsii TaxID=1187904 RepID=A0A8H7EG95_9PLEO|nr:uncharacterized protein GT037_002580 [Alternaria burnsii]KAF7678832.1 hypothetical protein GT037_002580 [Alternaria burnsii]
MGIAYAATNDLNNADAQREIFQMTLEHVPKSRLDSQNRIVDVLKVASSMLNGEIEYRKQNYDFSFFPIREAIKHEENLTYIEPWGWMLPARHPCGAISHNFNAHTRKTEKTLAVSEDDFRADCWLI